MGSNIEKKAWTNFQKLYKKLRVTTFAIEVGRAIALWEAMEKRQFDGKPNLGTEKIRYLCIMYIYLSVCLSVYLSIYKSKIKTVCYSWEKVYVLYLPHTTGGREGLLTRHFIISENIYFLIKFGSKLYQIKLLILYNNTVHYQSIKMWLKPVICNFN